MKTIGNLLKSIRESKGLTQQELANKLFITRQAISKYELNLSQLSLENFMLILNELNLEASIKNGGISIMENKELNTTGYLKINARTAGFISNNIDNISIIFREHGISILGIVETLNETKPISSENYGYLDKGIYLHIDLKNSNIDMKYMHNPFYDKNKEFDYQSPLHLILRTVESKLNIDNSEICFVSYYPAVNYSITARNEISFAEIDLIKLKMSNFYNNFKPSAYDFVFPNHRAGYHRVKKDGLYGFIDAWSGKEIISCKFDFVMAFEHGFTDDNGNAVCRARLNDEWVLINMLGEII